MASFPAGDAVMTRLEEAVGSWDWTLSWSAFREGASEWAVLALPSLGEGVASDVEPALSPALTATTLAACTVAGLAAGVPSVAAGAGLAAGVPSVAVVARLLVGEPSGAVVAMAAATEAGAEGGGGSRSRAAAPAWPSGEGAGMGGAAMAASSMP